MRLYNPISPKLLTITLHRCTCKMRKRAKWLSNNSLRYLRQVCEGNEGSIFHLFEVTDFLNLAEE